MGKTVSEALLLPALLTLALLCCLRARADAYAAFVRGAKEGLMTAVEIAPYLCAMLTAVSLLRETGLLDRMQALLSPACTLLGIPVEAMSVVLLRPLSGSAALAAVTEVMRACGADSRLCRKNRSTAVLRLRRSCRRSRISFSGTALPKTFRRFIKKRQAGRPALALQALSLRKRRRGHATCGRLPGRPIRARGCFRQAAHPLAALCSALPSASAKQPGRCGE